jgi:hypothetical protein
VLLSLRSGFWLILCHLSYSALCHIYDWIALFQPNDFLLSAWLSLIPSACYSYLSTVICVLM